MKATKNPSIMEGFFLGKRMTQTGAEKYINVKLLEELIRRDPSPSNYYNLGVAYGRIGSLNLELSCYERALSIEGPKLDTLTNLFGVLESLNDQRKLVAKYWCYRRYVASNISLLLQCLTLFQRYEQRVLFRGAISKLKKKLTPSRKLDFILNWLNLIFSLSTHNELELDRLLTCCEQELGNLHIYEPLSKEDASLIIPLFNRSLVAYINVDQLRINSIHQGLLRSLIQDAGGWTKDGERRCGNNTKLTILFVSVGRYNVKRFLLDQVDGESGALKPDLLLINNKNEDLFKKTFKNIYIESASDYFGLECILKKYSTKYEKVYFDEVGMSIELQVLSAFRWEATTYTSWLHPVTTGTGGVDCYIASERTLRTKSETFSERIVLNGAIGVNLRINPFFQEKEISVKNEVLIGSIQNPNKYLPENDFLYHKLLQACPRVHLNFLLGTSECTNRKFVRRISLQMHNHGVTRDRFSFTEHRGRHQYLKHLESLDAIIDTPFWSGGNTTLDAIESGIPVFCLRGESLRGGHSASIIETLGQTNLIATSIKDLINLVADFSSSQETQKRVIGEFRLGVEENYKAFNESTPTIQGCLERDQKVNSSENACQRSS